MSPAKDAYLIRWVDAYGRGGWIDPEDDFETPFEVVSVGWFVEDNETYYVLAQSAGTSGAVHNTIQIPKVLVTHMSKIEFTDAKDQRPGGE